MTGRDRLPVWGRAYQIGVVVRDLDQAAAFFESIGIGPFEEGPSAHALDRRIYGKSEPEVEVRGLTAKMGSIEFEIMQPVKGPSIQAEFLSERGEGVVHICAFTDDLDRDIALMKDRGFVVISSAVLADGGKFAYFDTRAIGGLILELFQVGDEWG